MGFTYTWAHNLFILWVLSFLLWVVLCLKTQLHSLLSLRIPLFLSQRRSLHSWCGSLLFSLFLSSLPPYFSLYFPIYSSRWMAVLWLFLVINGNGGPILSFLSGCSIGSGGNGSDIPQGNIRQPRHGHSKQSHSRPSCSWSREARLGLKVCLGQDYKSNGHWVWHCGTRLGPMA